MPVRAYVATRLQSINHSLDRLGLASMQGQNLALTRIRPSVRSLYSNDLRTYAENLVMPGDCRKRRKPFERVHFHILPCDAAVVTCTALMTKKSFIALRSAFPTTMPGRQNESAELGGLPHEEDGQSYHHGP